MNPSQPEDPPDNVDKDTEAGEPAAQPSQTPVLGETMMPEVKIARPWRFLFGVLAMTAVADFFLYDAWPGLGWTLFMILFWLVLIVIHRNVRSLSKHDFALGIMMLASALQATIETSFSNVLVLILLTTYASGHFLHRHLGPCWRRALEGMTGLIWIPYAIAMLIERLLASATGKSRAGRFSRQMIRPLTIGIPVVIVVIPFLALLGGGNAIVGDVLGSGLASLFDFIAGLEGPSEMRVAFWLVVAVVMVGILMRKPASRLLRAMEPMGKWRLPESKDMVAAIWRTRLMLVAVNALFFFANTTDVIYLWMETALPADLTLSEFVHEGVNNLIASVVLAAVLLSGLFQQSRAVTEARGQKLLATLWIAQNIFLIGSVVLRLKMYVDAYQLTVLRLNLVFFLLLVCAGFLLLQIKIWRRRSFGWLVGGNLMAVVLLFFVLQFFDTNGYVARQNYQSARDNTPSRLDVDYLVELGPSAWPVLDEVAEDRARFGTVSDRAVAALEMIATEEHQRVEGEDWRSWQWRRSVAREALPAAKAESLAAAKSSVGNPRRFVMRP